MRPTRDVKTGVVDGRRVVVTACAARGAMRGATLPYPSTTASTWHLYHARPLCYGIQATPPGCTC